MTEPTGKEQYLNIADQCAATATSDLAASILVDGGNGTLRQLLNDAADAIRASWTAHAQAAPAAVAGPALDFADAYGGAREDLAIWKRRALAAERDLRAEQETSSRLAAEINALNGPTRMGEPAAVTSPGWKLVPVEPTPDMWKAARAVPDPNPPYPPHYALVWDAMLAASPTTQPVSQLPERDENLPAEQQGLFRKFDVRRLDGTDKPGGKHHGCAYFVLDVDHDPCARPALAAYADACEATHPALAADLRTKWGAVPAAQPAPRQEAQEPVAWQSRTRPTWGGNDRPWSPWEPCTKGLAEDCWKTPLLHDWAYEARALYTAPQPLPASQGDALDAEQHEMDARHAAIYRWMLSHVADVLSIFDNWFADEEADTDELHDALAARAAQEGKSHG